LNVNDVSKTRRRLYPQTSAAAFRLAVAALSFAVSGSAPGAFYVDCAVCHPVSAKGMSIISFQSLTNQGLGQIKVLRVAAGQTAAVQLSVTNSYGAKYALGLSNLGSSGLKDSRHHLLYAPDPTWTSYFPGTATNFFLAGPSAKTPAAWTFNLRIHTNTPSDVYFVKTQIAGYDLQHRRWSQQENFYLQVVAPEASP
jgi:hypothetical protein